MDRRARRVNLFLMAAYALTASALWALIWRDVWQGVPVIAVIFAVLLSLLAAFRGWLIYASRPGGRLSQLNRDAMTEWWYNNKTGEVEEGPQSLGSERDGPFATREDAARAPEIIAERARRWAAEDAAGD
jgi:hypothetical protein